jgi:diguanylate cyclase (GGDEF)-like protein
MEHPLIEAALAARHAPIPPTLRSRFHAFHRAHNLRFLLVINLLGQAAYFSYGLADALLIPDVLKASIAARSFLLLTTLPLVLTLFRRCRSMPVLDLLVPGLIVLAAATWFELLNHSRSPNVATYQYASVIFIVLANLAVRVHFRPALLCSVLISAVIVQGVVRIHGGFNEATLVFSLVYLPVLFFSLFISWTSTLNGRQAFLRSLLDEGTRQDLLAANGRLRALADTDPLTGLPNRRQFDAEAERAWYHARQRGHSLALLMIDIDHFKPYNDHYGHPAGDACLVRVAGLLASHMCEGEYLAGRWGGEEFAVLLTPAGPALVATVAQRLLDAVAQLAVPHAHRPDGGNVVTFSIGGALSSEPGVASLAMLVERSDARLYQAKRAGRGRAVMT